MNDSNSDLHSRLVERAEQRTRQARAKIERQNHENRMNTARLNPIDTLSTPNLNENTRTRIQKRQLYGLDQRNGFQYRNNQFGQALESQNRELLRNLREDQEARATSTYNRNQAHQEDFYEAQDKQLSSSRERINMLEDSLSQIKDFQAEQERQNHENRLQLQRERARLQEDYNYLVNETHAEYEARMALNNKANARVFNELEASTDDEIETLKMQHELEKQELQENNKQEMAHVERKYLNFLGQQDAEHRREIDSLNFKFGNTNSLAAKEHQKELELREQEEKNRIHQIQKTADMRVREALEDQRKDREALINAHNFAMEKQELQHQNKVQIIKDSYERRIAEMQKAFEQRRIQQNGMHREALDTAYQQASKGYTKQNTLG